jgi:hypothetical protein
LGGGRTGVSQWPLMASTNGEFAIDVAAENLSTTTCRAAMFASEVAAQEDQVRRELGARRITQ